MSGEGNGKLPVFKIDYSGLVAKQIKQVFEDSRSLGMEQEVTEAMATILRRLRRDPLGFGELVKEYKQLKLLEHVAVVKPLVVHFDIQKEARVVFTQDCDCFRRRRNFDVG